MNSNKFQYENTRITGKLKEILEKELAAGNKIGDIYEGDWPQKGALMIFPIKTV